MLLLKVYAVPRTFPREETFRLVAQLRRAATSVLANLVEGAGRLNRTEYPQFAASQEIQRPRSVNHLLLARDLDYVAFDNAYKPRAEYSRVGQMLTRLAQSLR